MTNELTSMFNLQIVFRRVKYQGFELFSQFLCQILLSIRSPSVICMFIFNNFSC